MKPISSTRMELLARKIQIRLAKQGHDLLEQKRSALLEELQRTTQELFEEAESVQRTAATAQFTLARAHAMAGTEEVKSAALAARTELTLDVRNANVMGVMIPVIEQKSVVRSILDRGYALVGTSICIDETAEAFEAEVDAILHLAGAELRLKRLLAEIQRTSRRLNALEHILIPRLESEARYIEMTLDERERSDHYRLKQAKHALDRRAAL